MIQKLYSFMCTQRSWKYKFTQKPTHESLCQLKFHNVDVTKVFFIWWMDEKLKKKKRNYKIEETNIYYWVKEANLKWVHTVWFHIHGILTKEKNVETMKRSVIAGGRVKTKMNKRSTEVFFEQWRYSVW